MLAVRGRLTRGGSLVRKVSHSSLQEGTAGLGKPESLSRTTVGSPQTTHSLSLSLSFFCTHTPDVSALTNTRTISQTQTPLLFCFRWFVPPHPSPAWSGAGCFSSSQTRGCSPAPPRFSVDPGRAAEKQTRAHSDYRGHDVLVATC